MRTLSPKMVMYLLDLCPQLAAFPAGIFTRHQLPGPRAEASSRGKYQVAKGVKGSTCFGSLLSCMPGIQMHLLGLNVFF